MVTIVLRMRDPAIPQRTYLPPKLQQTCLHRLYKPLCSPLASSPHLRCISLLLQFIGQDRFVPLQ
jgi:hypothetical protein